MPVALDAFVDVKPHIEQLEPMLRDAHLPVARLCAFAGIYPSTWVRWKQGRPARGSKWQSIMRALQANAPKVFDQYNAQSPPVPKRYAA